MENRPCPSNRRDIAVEILSLRKIRQPASYVSGLPLDLLRPYVLGVNLLFDVLAGRADGVIGLRQPGGVLLTGKPIEQGIEVAPEARK